jgi:hypothetical protein
MADQRFDRAITALHHFEDAVASVDRCDFGGVYRCSQAPTLRPLNFVRVDDAKLGLDATVTHRKLEPVQVPSTERAAICAAFSEPSGGLEPPTPSLPCARHGNWSQPSATIFAVAHLRPVATACNHPAP